MAIITLTTDFGTRDGYVGAMKGVLARNAATEVVDLAHDIPPGDIAHAAWVVLTACREFPTDAVHLVVVDPGVGGARRAVAVRDRDGRMYVGPDNGVFAYIAGGAEAFEIESHEMFEVSPTFHGRDLFAPAAAQIAAGNDPSFLGSKLKLVGALPWGARPANEGRIVHIDRFGTLISDLPAAEVTAAVAIAGRTYPLHRTFGDVPSGAFVAYIGSAGTVELAVRDGRADVALGATRGLAVVPIGDGEPAPAGPYR